MPIIWKTALFIYSLLLVFIAGIVILTGMGNIEVLNLIEASLATVQNRALLVIVGVLLFVIGLAVIVSLFKREPRPQYVLISDGVMGQVLITIPAIKVIIMKAVKKIEGLKEVKTEVNNTNTGLSILIKLMINPDYNVPELSQNIQTIVNEHLHEIGGLNVVDIKVLVDDFYAYSKPAND